MNMLMKWIRESLVRRLVGPALVLSVVAVVVVGLIAYYSVRNILIGTAHTRLASAIDRHDAELKRWIDDQKQDIVFLSRTPFFRENVANILSYESSHRYHADGSKNLSEFLFSYIKNYQGIREIMILSGVDGKVLLSTSRESEGQLRADYSLSGLGDEDVLTRGIYSWVGTGEPAFTVARPLLDASGVRKGVLVVHLDLDRMAQVVFGHAGLGATGETYVVSLENRLISAQRSGQPEFLWETYSEGIQEAIQGGRGGGLYKNYAGVPVVGAYRWLPNLEVALLAEVSQQEAFASARTFGLLIVAIGTFLSGLLFVGNLVAARRIAGPLMNMSLMASRVAAGDLSAKIMVKNRDETGVLAESFNRMVERLKDLYGELQTKAAYFKTVFQLSPDAIAVLNFETGVISDVSESFGALFGFLPEEAIGSSVAELNVWYSRKDRLRFANTLRGKAVVHGEEFKLKRKDGSFFTGRISARMIELDGVLHVISVIWNISELQRIEAALRSNEERLQLIIDRMPIGCVVWNTDFNVELWNPAAEEIFGYTSEEAQGRHANDLVVPEDVVPRMEKLYQRLLTGDRTAHSENANKTRDGRIIYCDWHNTPLRDQNGLPIGAMSMVRDISDRKVTERQLERYRLHLEELVSERTRQLEETQAELIEKERLAVLGQLTATVSHELRNPLGTVSNAIFSVRDALQKQQVERVDKALTLADRNVRRCDSIISELLDFTRNQELVRKALDLGPWLKELVAEHRRPKEIDLVCELPVGFVVAVDPERLRRAIVNILDNAVQALGESSSGNARITLSLKRADGKIGLDVVDNGPGITEDVMSRVFEPLFSTKGFGVGLGMSVVKNIIEDYGGDVAVTSAPGTGTTVTLWLPGQREE